MVTAADTNEDFHVEMDALFCAGKPRVWWKCKVNGCARRGYSGPEGWVRHARRFHKVTLRPAP